MRDLASHRCRPDRLLVAVIGALFLALTSVRGAASQLMPVALALGPTDGCDGAAFESRLRSAHPLGATASAEAVCLGAGQFAWVPSSRMSPEERAAFLGAVHELVREQMGTCRAAGLALRDLEQADRVRVWAEPDTVQGMVYYGATYLTTDAVPLAVHFWSAAFSRSAEWLVAAVAHEGYHVIRPEASEAEAVRAGRSCALPGPWMTGGFQGRRGD